MLRNPYWLSHSSAFKRDPPDAALPPRFLSPYSLPLTPCTPTPRYWGSWTVPILTGLIFQGEAVNTEVRT